MKAFCWVGGCDWEAEAELTVELVKAAEAHRAEKHFWVKPGRVHRIELEPVEPIVIEPSGRKASMKRDFGREWV